jgi:Leucine Rich repeat
LYLVDYIHKKRKSNGSGSNGSSIRILELEQCQFENATVCKVFCDRLLASSSSSYGPALKQVNLNSISCNDDSNNIININNNSIDGIGNILVNNATLETLHLQHCYFASRRRDCRDDDHNDHDDDHDDDDDDAAAGVPARTLGQGLACNTTLQALHLTRCGLQNQDLARIVEPLLLLLQSSSSSSSQTHRRPVATAAVLKHVDLSYNNIAGTDGGRLVGVLIRECFPTSSLQEIVLAHNPQFGPLGARALAASLVRTTSPSAYSPPKSSSSSSSSSLSICSRSMSCSPIVLVKLDLTCCSLGNEGIENLILPSTARSSTMFTNAAIDDDDANAAANVPVPTCNRSITTLILCDNGIHGVAGGQALGTLLRQCFVNVQHLDLSRNALGINGLYRLVFAMQPPNDDDDKQGIDTDDQCSSSSRSRRSFQHFNLTRCSLGEPGRQQQPTIAIIPPLEVHRLDLSENCRAGNWARTTTVVGLGGGGVGGGDDSGEVLVQAILSCFTKNVQELELRDCHIGPTGAQMLVTGLLQPQPQPRQSQEGGHHHELQLLGLSGCNLGHDGARLVADCIATHDHVQVLDLGGNHVSPPAGGGATIRAIARMVRQCKNLRKLDLSNNSDLFNDYTNDQPSSTSSAVAAEVFARALEQTSTATTATNSSSSSSLRELILTSWDDRDGPIEFEDRVQDALLSGLQKNGTLHAVDIDLDPENQRRLESMLQRNRMMAHVVESLNPKSTTRVASSPTPLIWNNMFVELMSRHHNNVAASAAFLLLCNHHTDILPSSSSNKTVPIVGLK